MTKNKFLIILLILTPFLAYISCQKRLLGHVKVNGRILDYFTNLPISAKVELRTGDATSSKNSTEQSITLCSTTTGADGTFSLKSRPSRRGGYYLYVDGKPFDIVNGRSEIFIKVNQDNDLGDIIGGKHKFFCNITIVPTSTLCIDVRKGIPEYVTDANGYFNFSSGTSTQFTHSNEYDFADFENNNHNYLILYQTNDCVNTQWGDYTRYTVNVPINSLSGTLTTTISY